MAEIGNFVVGVATYKRHQLASECIASILNSEFLPVEISVVDNSGKYDLPFRNQRIPITVHRPGHNSGRAATWNYHHRSYAPRDVVLLDDDLILNRDVLGALVNDARPFTCAMADRVWSCFRQKESIWKDVGEYDEGFWPTFWDDTDYEERMKRAGYDVCGQKLVVQHAGVQRQASTATKDNPEKTRFEFNRARFQRKWGEDKEYANAWNSKQYNELEWYYTWECNSRSDINEHLPTLRRLSSECSHVTEFGARTGRSTTALLSAQPDHLITYDISPHPDLDNLFHMRGQTQLTVIIADTAFSTIDSTDMLFIDTHHSHEQLKLELHHNHDRVRKYIVMHDTVKFGDVAETPHRWFDSGAGLNKAVKEFLEEFPQWKVVEHHKNNNGLTVMSRSHRPVRES